MKIESPSEMHEYTFTYPAVGQLKIAPIGWEDLSFPVCLMTKFSE